MYNILYKMTTQDNTQSQDIGSSYGDIDNNKIKNISDPKKLTPMQEEIKRLKSEIGTMKQHRTEKNRPSVWINRDKTLIEIHYNNKTIISKVINIDRETPRESSDYMALGSGFKQVTYKDDENE